MVEPNQSIERPDVPSSDSIIAAETVDGVEQESHSEIVLGSVLAQVKELYDSLDANANGEGSDKRQAAEVMIVREVLNTLLDARKNLGINRAMDPVIEEHNEAVLDKVRSSEERVA